MDLGWTKVRLIARLSFFTHDMPFDGQYYPKANLASWFSYSLFPCFARKMMIPSSCDVNKMRDSTEVVYCTFTISNMPDGYRIQIKTSTDLRTCTSLVYHAQLYILLFLLLDIRAKGNDPIKKWVPTPHTRIIKPIIPCHSHHNTHHSKRYYRL